MKQCPFWLLMVLFVFGLSKLPAQSDGIFDVSTVSSSEHLAPYSLIIPDSEHSYSLASVLANDSIKSTGFTPENQIPYLDFTRSSYWMILDLKNRSSLEQSFYVELARPLTNQVNLYILD